MPEVFTQPQVLNEDPTSLSPTAPQTPHAPAIATLPPTLDLNHPILSPITRPIRFKICSALRSS